MTPEDALPTPQLPKAEPKAKAVSRWRKIKLRRDAPWWLYLGVIIMMAGFALIAFAWLKVAELANVVLQIPYLISSAISGLALVFVGLGIVDATTRRRDARERSRQLGQLRDLLSGIADSMEPKAGDEARETKGDVP